MEVRGTTEEPQVPIPLDLVRSRLAELVVHLSDCDPNEAVAAVRAEAPDGAPADHEGRLAIVAAALLRVRRAIDLRESVTTAAKEAEAAAETQKASPTPA
jgi:hypothetical protein